MELQQKQAELQIQSQSTWSSLFRGNKQNPPSLLDIQNEQAQIELVRQHEQMLNSSKQKQNQMSSLLAKPQPPQPTSWAAWGSNSGGNNSSVSQMETINSNFPLPTAPTTAINNSSAATPFWNTPQESKKQPQSKK